MLRSGTHYLLEVYNRIDVGSFVRFAAILHKAKVLMNGIILEVPPCNRIVLGGTLYVWGKKQTNVHLHVKDL